MVIVPFTISAWFLWCTDFSIPPKADGRPLTGKTYMQESMDGFFSSVHSEKHRYPAKKRKKKKKQQ